MKNLLLSLILLAVACSATAQPMTAPDQNRPLAARPENNRWWVQADGYQLEGTAGWKLVSGGYLTLLALDGAGIATTLRTFTRRGQETHRAEFPQVINLTLDPAGRTAVFHDGRTLHALDLGTFRDQTFAGASLAFAVGPHGEVAFCESAGRIVVAAGVRYSMLEAPHQLLYAHDRLLALTRHGLYELTNGQALDRHRCAAGATGLRLRATPTGVELTEKHRTPARTLIRTWRTADFTQFTLVRTRERPDAWVSARPARYCTNSYAGHPTPTREPIRGPLNYADADVFGEVGNSYNEMQEYGGGTRYLHPGVDLMGVVGQDVRAVRAGVVRAVLTTGGPEYWRVAVSYGLAPADSVGYLYAHLNQDSIAFVPGDSVRAGERIANLVDFFRFNFDHCHFARVTDATRQWTGAWWTVDDPVVDMVNHRDTEAPRLLPAAPTGELLAFRHGPDDYLSPDSLTGYVDIISRPADRVNSVQWDVDVYDERYALRPDRPVGQPAPVLFDTLAYRFDFRNDRYTGLGAYADRAQRTLYSRDTTCFATGNYQERAFFHLLTHGDGDRQFLPADSLRTFNTAAYPDGAYWLTVTVHDAAGNLARDSMRVQFRNQPLGSSADHVANQVRAWPNPTTETLHLSGLDTTVGTVLLTDVLGRQWRLAATPEGPGQHRVELRAVPPGAYRLDRGDGRGLRVLVVRP